MYTTPIRGQRNSPFLFKTVYLKGLVMEIEDVFVIGEVVLYAFLYMVGAIDNTPHSCVIRALES